MGLDAEEITKALSRKEKKTMDEKKTILGEPRLLTEDSVNVPLGAVVIPLSEYKELIQNNAQMECLLDDILAYVNEEAYIRRDTILKMMGVDADE